MFPLGGEEELSGGLRVKLSGFRGTRRTGARATAGEEPERWGPWLPPELADCVAKEAFSLETAADVWALGILVFLLCRARFPWPRAQMTAASFREYREWRKG